MVTVYVVASRAGRALFQPPKSALDMRWRMVRPTWLLYSAALGPYTTEHQTLAVSGLLFVLVLLLLWFILLALFPVVVAVGVVVGVVVVALACPCPMPGPHGYGICSASGIYTKHH